MASDLLRDDLNSASDNRILMPHFSNEDIRPVIRKPNEYKEAQLAKRTDKVRYVAIAWNGGITEFIEKLRRPGGVICKRHRGNQLSL